MIQGILFDMDGILFDTERTSIDVCHAVAAEFGFTMPEGYAEAICGASHARYEEFMRENLGADFDFDAYSEACRARHALFLEREGVPKKKGLDEALAALQAGGFPMAVASSTRTKTVLHHLESAGIRQYFSAVIGGDMVTRSKPEPEIFEKAAAALGLAPAACCAVEDSVNGVRAGNAAGCVTVMIPDMIAPTDELRGLSAAVLDSLLELPAFVENYNRKI